MSDVWPEERIAKLKSLRAEGYSASRIAVLIGGSATRNAVIAKLNRLGVPWMPKETQSETISQEKKIRAAAARRAKEAEKPAPRPRPLANVVSLFKPEPTPFTGKPKLLTELNYDDCRWPVEDGPPGQAELTRFCSVPKDGEHPYCSAHCRRAYGPKYDRKAPTTPSPVRRRAS